MAAKNPPALMRDAKKWADERPKLTTTQIGEKIGKSQEHVSKLLLIGELDGEILAKWENRWNTAPVPVNTIRDLRFIKGVGAQRDEFDRMLKKAELAKRQEREKRQLPRRRRK